MKEAAQSAATVTTFRPSKSGSENLAKDILRKLAYGVGKTPSGAKDHDWLAAAILAIRDRVIDAWMNSVHDVYESKGKRVYYLSMEFLIGRLLRDAVCNLGLMEELQAALKQLNVDLDIVEALEPDAALGNGGLGRLAACFMESMSSLGIPAYGYGIRYRFGLFRQMIIDGVQVELPEDWLAHGNPWEFERRERQYKIGFGGAVDVVVAKKGGEPKYVWKPSEQLLAVAYDTPICGWRGSHVNTLRLWNAKPVDPLRLDQFNSGDHIGAQEDEARAEALTRVLYPSDASPSGQELRLRQEFFFTSASLQDMLRRHMGQHGDILTLSDKAAVQMNDTHPAIAVAELMRLLIDEHGLSWDKAWTLTRATTSYTNHTLLPEALESWPIHLFERLLPRHMQIIYAINAGVIADAHKQAMTDFGFLARISLIDEGHGRRVRMGQLAFAGSHSINGVSALHSDLMKQTVFKDLNTLYPGRINNKTNGVTPRRWLQQVNPGLTSLIKETIGPKFLDDAMELKALDKYAADAAFREKFAAEKRANKVRLAEVIMDRTGVPVDPSALFDIQIKRIHEYKRQLLAILETIALYNSMRAHPERNWVPRVKIFAGKAARELLAGEIGDPPDQRRGPRDQRRSRRARASQGRVHPQLQCQPRRIDRARGGYLGADLDRRHGSLGHRQHEARHQRRAHRRHARWRQCGDQRDRRTRERLHLRHDRRRSRRKAQGRLRAARDRRTLAPPQGGHRAGLPRPLLAHRSPSATTA